MRDDGALASRGGLEPAEDFTPRGEAAVSAAHRSLEPTDEPVGAPRRRLAQNRHRYFYFGRRSLRRDYIREREPQQSADLLLGGPKGFENISGEPEDGHQRGEKKEEDTQLKPIALYPITVLCHRCTSD